MNPFSSGTRLRDMIRSICACKTTTEERAVVRKECAAIRDSINENDQDYRHRNLAKLMFIHMLSYPTHFCPMEYLKLIAAADFPEKRIGYLGLMLLLDEKQEVLMLATNSLKQDLKHTNQYIVELALCALGNICSTEMAHDLAPEVERSALSKTIEGEFWYSGKDFYLSTGTFLAASRYASATPLPPSILSHGVGWQGDGIFLSGIFGTGIGPSVAAENVGLLALTRVGSRRVVQRSAGFMIFFSILCKFVAIFASIPSPIVVALYCLFFAYVGSAGLSLLQFCNLNSFRTKFVLGFLSFPGTLGASVLQGVRIGAWLRPRPHRSKMGKNENIFS